MIIIKNINKTSNHNTINLGQTITFDSPPYPLIEEITGYPFNIYISGQVSRDYFQITLGSEHCEGGNGCQRKIPFHISIRPYTRRYGSQIIRKYCPWVGGTWHRFHLHVNGWNCLQNANRFDQKWIHTNPIKPRDHFTAVICVRDDLIRVSLNGHRGFEWRHRLPAREINRLIIDTSGNALIEQVKIEYFKDTKWGPQCPNYQRRPKDDFLDVLSRFLDQGIQGIENMTD